MDRTSSQPIELFYCYAEKDRALLQKLDQHLIGLRSAHLITPWHEGTISPGMSKQQEIETHLRHASVILLLISADFLQSDYYSSQALVQAIERHRAGNAYVVPILLRPVDYSGTPFAELPMLPSDGRPVTLWSNRDAALEDIARSIRNIVLTLLAQQHMPSGLHEMTQQGMEWSAIPALPSPPQQRRVRQQSPHIGTQFNIQDLHIHAASISKTEQREIKQRAILLNRVEQKWIKGLLQQSFYEKVQIGLELQEHPQMVSNPWQEIVQELTPSSGPLPSGMPIQEIYDHSSGELLILGRSGAGKTILLLELLRVLLERARSDESHPIPVVFYLSSWAQRRQPLEQWLIEELRSKYKIPLELATRWIKDKKDQVILPLLDGLDEVVQPARAACMNAINTYRSHYGLTSLVVCCRIKGDCGGILFHHTVSQIGTNYYGLSVCSDSQYIFFKRFRGDLHTKPSVLWDPHHSDAFHIRLGQSNTVAIVVRQNQFTLFFNRQRIASFANNDMPIGSNWSHCSNSG